MASVVVRHRGSLPSARLCKPEVTGSIPARSIEKVLHSWLFVLDRAPCITQIGLSSTGWSAAVLPNPIAASEFSAFSALRHRGTDVRSRVAAIEFLLREGLGRPPQAEEAESPRLPRTAKAVEKLDWGDMKLIFATHFASEIAAVTGDGDALLRERVAALHVDQRQLLREALDEVEIAS